MKRVAIVTISAVCLAAANPVLESFLTEFSADPAHQWVELTGIYESGYETLTGWQIVTSTSSCTLDCVLPGDARVVVDSASLANQTLGRGTFRLKSDDDFIAMRPPAGKWWWNESTYYSALPAGLNRSPAPLPGTSSAYWTEDFALSQASNWYVDSSPTPGELNTHYSSIKGSVLLDSIPSLMTLCATASGPSAIVTSENYDSLNFTVDGLGSGKYCLSIDIESPRGSIQGSYPDSIEVPFWRTVSGIRIDLRTGVAEKTPARAPGLALTSSQGVLTVFAVRPDQARLTLYDQSGRQRAELFRGRLAPGVHSFQAGPLLSSGVYFARLETVSGSFGTRLTILR